MPIRRIKVESLPDYIRSIGEIRDSWILADGQYFDPWFRGQLNLKWALLPSLYRHGLEDEEEDLRELNSSGAVRHSLENILPKTLGTDPSRSCYVRCYRFDGLRGSRRTCK